ncbi:MAG: O-antigen ligase family protein [Chloroflexi bacterium]|nr:O-antigen ligase family protein [Chloroflexota bacterium]
MNHTLTPRARAAALMTRATQLAFAALLFTSPWMLQWLDVQRRVEPVFAGYTDFFVYPSDLFLGLTVGLGLLRPFVEGPRFKRGPWYFFFPLVALVALGLASTLVSVDPALTLYHSVRLLFFFGLYLALVNTPLRAEWVAVPLALAVLIQSSVAILQFAKQASIGLQALGELSLNPAETGLGILRYDDVRILRAYGLTDHPNLLGGFIAFALVYILGYYLHPAHGRARYLFLAPLALGIVALFFTFSRSAELAFGIAAALMVLALLRDQATRRLRTRDVGIAVALCALLLILPVVGNQRLLAQRVGLANAFVENFNEARSLGERDELMESANRIFYQRQLLGVGNGALALGMFYLDNEFPRDQYFIQPAHLVVLDVAAEFGILGGFVWFWLMLAPLAVMWQKRAGLMSNAWCAAIAAAVVVTLVVGLFDYYTWFWQSGRIWQWSAWGLFAAVFANPAVSTNNAIELHRDE